MSEIKIDINELSTEGRDLIEELAEFLKKKTKAATETTANAITVKSKEESVSRVQLRMLLRKFVYNQGLKDYFRIIGGKDNALVIKEIKTEKEDKE